MTRRIITAREQWELLSPWLIEADLYNPGPEDYVSGNQTKMFPNKDFRKTKPEEPNLPEGWHKEKVKSGPKETTVITSPFENQYRVDEEGYPIDVTPAEEMPSFVSPGVSVRVPKEELNDLPKSPNDRALPGFSTALAKYLVPDLLERSIMEKYNDSEESTREAGGQWYDTANEYIHNLAQKAGLDPHKVGAIVSAFSPQTSWDQNMAAANYFIMNYDPNNPDAINDKMGGLSDNLERAKRIYAAGDQDGYVAALQNGNEAQKITNFYHNLMGHKDNVTIDSWMARALMGQGLDLADKDVQKVLGWKDGKGNTGYDIMANAVRSAAQKLSEQTGREITPRELQAIVWSHVVPTAGGYDELTPQEWAKKDKQRTKYIEDHPDSKILPDYFHGPGWRAAPEPTYLNRKGRWILVDREY